jgi:hypothetical protein
MYSIEELELIQRKAVELFQKQPNIGTLKIGLFMETTNGNRDNGYDLNFSIEVKRYKDGEEVKNLETIEMNKDELIHSY